MVPKVILKQLYFNSVHLGQRLRQIPIPKDCYVLGLIRSSHLITVRENPILQEQDWVIVVTAKEALVPELTVFLERCQVSS